MSGLIPDDFGLPGSGTGTDPQGSLEIEFATLEEAQDARGRSPGLLSESDDRRRRKVKIDPEDADERSVDRLAEDALATFADERDTTFGMAELSDTERRKLQRQHDSFQWQQHGFQAMRAKSAIEAQGVTDWMDHFEPGEGFESSLSKIEESKQRAAETGVGTAIEGMRHDAERAESSRAEIAQMIERARSRQEKHAVKHAKKGDQEALRALEEQFGWSHGETQKLKSLVDDPRTPFTSDDITRVEQFERSRASGRFVATPTNRTHVEPGHRSRTSGRFAPGPNKRSEPEFGRDTDSGKFVRRDGL